MKIFRILALPAAAVLAIACGSDQPANQANGSAANTTGQTQNTAANSGISAMGPAATIKALSEASQKKDVEGIKRYLSRGTIERLEQGAKEEKTTADELLKREDGAPFPTVPELGREEITGDTATLEVRNAETKQFEKLPFVKEDGVWKVAIDKYLDDLDAAMEEKPPAKP